MCTWLCQMNNHVIISPPPSFCFVLQTSMVCFRESKVNVSLLHHHFKIAASERYTYTFERSKWQPRFDVSELSSQDACETLSSMSANWVHKMPARLWVLCQLSEFTRCLRVFEFYVSYRSSQDACETLRTICCSYPCIKIQLEKFVFLHSTDNGNISLWNTSSKIVLIICTCNIVSLIVCTWELKQ